MARLVRHPSNWVERQKDALLVMMSYEIPLHPAQLAEHPVQLPVPNQLSCFIEIYPEIDRDRDIPVEIFQRNLFRLLEGFTT